jgi:NAD(P)-dependent dehydrogenase (short-subunit alcohol dehydrogenase family)
MRALAVELAPHMIRVNTIHPTSVNTAMIINEATYDLLVPGAEPAARHGAQKVPDEVAQAFKGINACPPRGQRPRTSARRSSSWYPKGGRYVSGTQLSVDAGAAAK